MHQPKSTVELSYICPLGPLVHEHWRLASSWNTKETFTKVEYNILKSDFIFNMDHMNISSTEPTLVIYTQTMYYEHLKYDAQKVPNQAEAKTDHVMKYHL